MKSLICLLLTATITTSQEARNRRTREKVREILWYGEDVKEEANLMRVRVLVLVSRFTNRGALATIDTEVLYFLLFFFVDASIVVSSWHCRH